MALAWTSRVSALRGWRADAAGFVSGAIAALALPPLYVLPALLIGIPVLLCLIQGARGPMAAARRGWWFGFGLHLVGLYWITEAILIESARFWWLVPFAVPALSAVLAVFIADSRCRDVVGSAGLASRVHTGRNLGAGRSRPPVCRDRLPMESARQRMGVSRASGDIMIQPASVVGAHGLTLATILLASLPLLRWAWRFGGLALLAAWFGFGLLTDRSARCPNA